MPYSWIFELKACPAAPLASPLASRKFQPKNQTKQKPTSGCTGLLWQCCWPAAHSSSCPTRSFHVFKPVTPSGPRPNATPQPPPSQTHLSGAQRPPTLLWPQGPKSGCADHPESDVLQRNPWIYFNLIKKKKRQNPIICKHHHSNQQHLPHQRRVWPSARATCSLMTSAHMALVVPCESLIQWDFESHGHQEGTVTD